MTENTGTSDFQQKFEECDNKFRTIFELTSVACKVIDSNLNILKVNRALCDLLGYSEEEIIGTEILDYACEDCIPHWHQLQEELWRKQRPFFKLDTCLVRKDRSLVWVKITTILFKEEGVTFGFTVLDDITGQKHFEESEKRLSPALRYSKVAAWEMNLDDYSVIRSESHDLIFGYKKPLKKWNLRTYLKHFVAEDAKRFEQAIQSAGNHSSFDFKGRIHTDNMSFKVIHLEGQAEFDEPGKRVRIIGTVKDITKDKLLERQKDDFISIASHELKTPITSLNASLQLINKNISSQDGKTRKLIAMANKSMLKVSTLVKDLLSATSIGKGQLDLNKSTFKISQLVEDCCDHIRFGGKYKITIYGDLNLKIFADAERIEQVITNLVNNAVKYAPDSKEIRVEITKLENKVKTAVTDTGPGIPAEKIQHLFERFYRVESSGIRYSGLGLGLYISSEIIKMHGGEIGAISQEGVGSTLWFTLPAGD